MDVSLPYSALGRPSEKIGKGASRLLRNDDVALHRWMGAVLTSLLVDARFLSSSLKNGGEGLTYLHERTLTSSPHPMAEL